MRPFERGGHRAGLETKGALLATTEADTHEKHGTEARPPDDASKGGSSDAEPSGAVVRHDIESVPARRPGRWWRGVAVGIVVGLPLSWLLSYAATLPFFIGLFFFALFGLVIGAFVYRVAAKSRPCGRASVLIGTTLIVLVCWGLALQLEAWRFPGDIADYAAENSPDLGGRDLPTYLQDVSQKTTDYLRRTYPPGGLIGYARWSMLNGRITRNDIPELVQPFRSNQARIWWAVRVVVSIALLAFGIGSQTLPLTQAPRAPGSSPDEPPDRDPDHT